MASPLRQVGGTAAVAPPTAPPPSLLRLFPGLTLAAFLLPIAAGLLGTLLPAFGYLPALGGRSLGLAPWQQLFAHPSLPGALKVTLASGIPSSLLACAVVIGFVATCHETRLFGRVRRLLAPLLAMPHAAAAIGLAFLIAPSGLILRLLSPWATGSELPPDLLILRDPWGLSLALGLTVKEVPFLLLMTLGALGQSQATRHLAVARTLGYGPATAWLKTVLPAVYPQIRLPIYAVLAYSLSVVDMAMILGPATPPSLAVLVFYWFNDPDLSLRFVGAAGAILQLIVVAAAIGLWRLGECLATRLGRRWLTGGGRGGGWWGGRAPLARHLAAGGMLAIAGLGLANLAVLALWSVTQRWRFPDSLPSAWTLATWERHLGALLATTGTTFVIGFLAALIALVLTVGCLEHERRHGLTPGAGALWLLYTPLLVPQIAFLFGIQILIIQTGIDATWTAMVWSHLLFVLPYTFLALADPYRRFDERFVRAALCLRASPAQAFRRVKLPILLRPILFALGVGFAVSVAQYLPTVFAGAGRFATLTTEAVTLSAGGDRRVIAVYAFLQALLPLIAFALALAAPNWIYRNRRALRGHL